MKVGFGGGLEVEEEEHILSSHYSLKLLGRGIFNQENAVVGNQPPSPVPPSNVYLGERDCFLQSDMKCQSRIMTA